jgi:hypothetical protein
MVRNISVFATAFILLTAQALASSPYEGEWRSAELMGIANWDNGNCVGLFYRVRKYVLVTRPQTSEIGGTYLSETHVRYIHNMGRQCKALGDDTPAVVVTRLLDWFLSSAARPDGSLEVAATFDKCTLLGCKEPNLFTNGFRSALSIQGNELHELPEGFSESNTLLYHRDADAARRIAGLQPELFAILQSLATTSPADFVERYSASDPSPASTKIDQITLLQRLVRHLSTREVIDSEFFDYFGHDNKEEPIEVAYFLMEAHLDTGEAVPEIAVIRKEGGAWKLLNYNLAD